MTSHPPPAADPGALGVRAGHHRSARTIDRDELPAQARVLFDAGFRLALVAGHDDHHLDHGRGGLRAVYLFTAPAPDLRVELHIRLDRTDPSLPTLAGLSFPAGRFEREMRDLFGITPAGHPLPARLVRHFHWPKGWYPMLADAGPPPEFGETDGPYPFRTVEGPGVYEIPVGPVHAGMIGPGHFRFSVVGETILNLKARLWFVHRGIEKLFQGRRPDQALELAERISGDTAIGHTLAFCQAVEDAQGLTVLPRAQRLRAILLELERLHNHITDIGALCNDVGHSILNTHAQRVREQLLRINDHVTGHRLLRGAIYPGGTTIAALPDPSQLAAIADDIGEIVELALGNPVVLDRFTGTAILTRTQATDLGTLGYVARASGLATDARRDHPHLLPPLPPTASTHTNGDVLSRFTARVDDIATSIALITHHLEHLEHLDEPEDMNELAQHTPPGPGQRRSGVGIVEGWRGTITHRVELTDTHTGTAILTRVKIVDPSFFNWPALPVALADTIVPDFPLTNKSFNLSYAGNDL